MTGFKKRAERSNESTNKICSANSGLAGDDTLETLHHGPVEGLILCGAASGDVDALHPGQL